MQSLVLFKRIPCCWGVWRWDTWVMMMVSLLGRMRPAWHLQLQPRMHQPRQWRWQNRTRTYRKRSHSGSEGVNRCQRSFNEQKKHVPDRSSRSVTVFGHMQMYGHRSKRRMSLETSILDKPAHLMCLDTLYLAEGNVQLIVGGRCYGQGTFCSIKKKKTRSNFEPKHSCTYLVLTGVKGL